MIFSVESACKFQNPRLCQSCISIQDSYMASKTKPTKTKPEFQILALVVMSKLYVHPKKHYGQENLGKPNQQKKTSKTYWA